MRCKSHCCIADRCTTKNYPCQPGTHPQPLKIRQRPEESMFQLSVVTAVEEPQKRNRLAAVTDAVCSVVQASTSFLSAGVSNMCSTMCHTHLMLHATLRHARAFYDGSTWALAAFALRRREAMKDGAGSRMLDAKCGVWNKPQATQNAYISYFTQFHGYAEEALCKTGVV